MYEFVVGECCLELVQGDITQSDTDAIANAANAMLGGGGGVDGAIHRAAGATELQSALRELKRALPGGVLDTGGAVITPGFNLKARHIIHCVGPIYDRDRADAAHLLASCYRAALGLCRKHGLSSVAFPSISSGVYGYPVEGAALVALMAVRRDVGEHGAPALTRFVLFDAPTLEVYRRTAAELFTSGS